MMKPNIKQGPELEIQAKEQELISRGFYRVQKSDKELKPFEYVITEAQGSEASFEGSKLRTIWWAEA